MVSCTLWLTQAVLQKGIFINPSLLFIWFLWYIFCRKSARLSIWEKETSLEGPSLCTNTLENRVEAVTRSPMQSQLELLVILLLTAVCAPPHTATPITSGVSALSVPEVQGRSSLHPLLCRHKAKRETCRNLLEITWD